MNAQEKLLASMNEFVKRAPKRGADGPATGRYADGDPRNTPGILDLLPPEAAPEAPGPDLTTGQGRRAWLDSISGRLDEALRYGAGGTGLDTRLGLIAPNPVGSLQESMRASGEMAAPGRTATERLGSAGEMLSNLGFAGLEAVGMGMGAKAPMKAFANGGEDAVAAFMRGDGGALDLWRLGMGGNGGPPLNAIDTVDLPPGNDPRYLGAAPDRAGNPFPRYAPKKVPDRMERLIGSADDPKNPIQSMFDRYIEKGKTVNGSDWYNTEEMRDWFVGELGEKTGDARWREFVDLIGATSTGSAVPDNLRNASFYNALTEADRANVAELVKGGGITPAAAARKLGIEVPNMPPEKGKGSYNYGHKMQGNHASNVLDQIDGQWTREGPPPELTGAALTDWLQGNPKVKGFANSMLGDTKNIAADKHFMRMLAMSDGGTDFLSQKASSSAELLSTLRSTYGKKIEPYIKTRTVNGKPTVEINLAKAAKDGVVKDTTPLQAFPTAWEDTPKATEYKALEEMAQRLATKYGMTPAQFQANLWMGASDLTGLADESQGTAMELFRRTLDKRAGERGISRKDMLKDFIHNRAPLALGPLGAIGLLNANAGDEQKGGT